MKVREWFRQHAVSRHKACLAAILVLLCIVAQDRLSNSRLKAEVTRFQQGHAALLTERASLLETSNQWKAEAIEWREKNGYVEPPIVPPEPNEDDREVIGAPHDPRP